MANPFTQLLGIDLALAQAPIGSASNPALCAAVSNAGGLGMLAATWLPLDELRASCLEIKRLTNRPYGVNVVLEWDQRARIAACLTHGPAVVSLFWGDPAPYVHQIHDGGALCCHTVANAGEARRAVDLGVDLVVAQGWEAGGHVSGLVAILALVPAVVDAVAGRAPVLAAGGIVDGRGMAAAMALGADGVWCGTRFLLAEEATIHPFYRDRLLAARETDTVYTGLFDVGWQNAPHRVLEGETFRMWRDAGCPRPGERPGEGEVVARYSDGAPIIRYGDNMPAAGASGNIDALALYAGQGIGLLSQVQPAADIARGMVEEARLLAAGLSARF